MTLAAARLGRMQHGMGDQAPSRPPVEYEILHFLGSQGTGKYRNRWETTTRERSGGSNISPRSTTHSGTEGQGKWPTLR